MLAGHLNPDLSFELKERDKTGRITGAFSGYLWRNFRVANGTWTSADGKRNFEFRMESPQRKSYWDYLHKYRSLKEYNDIHTAISDGWRVQCIDLDHQGLTSLPTKTNRLTSLLSANLLGNAFEEFPLVLTGLTQLQEISLASNNLKTIGKEIGKLKNLRVLIMNFNQLKSLPAEIGQLESLLYLEISDNQLSTLPDEIVNLKQLQELHVSRNCLSEIEKQRLRNLLPHCIIHF